MNKKILNWGGIILVIIGIIKLIVSLANFENFRELGKNLDSIIILFIGAYLIYKGTKNTKEEEKDNSNHIL